MDQHLTVSEARQFTGKSESTIKRLLRDIVGDPQHVDRLFVLPSADEVERRKAAKEPYVWKIDRQLLLRRFPQDETPVTASGGVPSGPTGNPSDLVMQVLQEQLRSKDEQMRTLEKQLDRKDEQIASLNDRMRESNVLMRELQQRLAITAPKAATNETVVDSAETPANTPSKPASSKTSSTKTKAKAKKAGLWSRLFRASH
jgi:hypothetical protein